MSEIDIMILETKLTNILLNYKTHEQTLVSVGVIVGLTLKCIEEQAEIKANEKYKAICEATDNLFKP